MEWQPIETAPKDGAVVLFCDKRGNRWTDCSPGHLSNGCGLLPLWWMPLPPPPEAPITDETIRNDHQPD